MIVQIYEIQTPEEAEKCIEAGVDHIGSVIQSKERWRLPEIKETIALSIGTPVKNSLIPLFNDFDIICQAIKYYGPDFIHFCDNLINPANKEPDLDIFIDMQSQIKHRFPDRKSVV